LAEGRTIIVYWDRHSGHEHEMRRHLIDEFNCSQDKVYVRALSIGFNASMEKLLTAIAGKSPPDICALDGGILSELVAQGCFEPLDDLASIPALGMQDLFPHCATQVNLYGHVWGIPTTTDTYCLLWNKNAFRKAGLDPEKPPTTLSELEALASKLTVSDGTGFQQIGFVPWQPWDMSGQWGLFFGGRWWDEERDEAACANDPNIIRMYEWQRSFARVPGRENKAYALDPEKLMAFQSGFGSYMSASNPFYTGKIAMIAEGEWQVTFIPKYAPELDWGVAPLPYPDGMEPMSYGGPCVIDCIPKGCGHPDAARAYLKWFYSARANGGASPASDYAFMIHNIPPRVHDAEQARFVDDPKFRVFVDVLKTRKIVSAPVTPLSPFLFDEIERQRERVVLGKTTAARATVEIQEKVNAELVNMRKLMRADAS
jgi:multiple sugar transport system substrate-binding protein